MKSALHRSDDASAYLRSLWVCLLLAAGVFAVAAVWLGLGKPYPGDEARFIETARLFGQGLSLDLLTHYEEMSTPLPFVYYGLWGEMFGYGLATMRIGALGVALAAVVAVHGLLYLCLSSKRAVVGTFLLVVLNPYFVTMGLFVYTDMPAVLFGLVACIGLQRRWGWMLAVGVAGALLCRQYMVFVVGAIGLWLALEYLLARRRDTLKLLAMAALGVLPLAGLVMLWRGPAPQNELKNLYLQYPTRYHLSALTLYVSQLSIYLLPVVVLLGRRLFRDRRVVIGCVLASCLYGLIPVRPSACAVDAGYETVGLFDRFVRLIGGGPWLTDAVFFAGFAVGLVVLVNLTQDVYSRVARKQIDTPLLMGLCVLAFLLVMPFSYLSWEKYFLPVLPMACVAVQWVGRSEESIGDAGG